MGKCKYTWHKMIKIVKNKRFIENLFDEILIIILKSMSSNLALSKLLIPGQPVLHSRGKCVDTYIDSCPCL